MWGYAPTKKNVVSIWQWVPRFLFILWFAIPASFAGDGVSRQLEIRSGQLLGESDTVRVSHGDRVKLLWIADRPLELHLHGYDIVANLVAGSSAVMDIDAFATGRFPITIHAPGVDDHHRAILYLEVIPK